MVNQVLISTWFVCTGAIISPIVPPPPEARSSREGRLYRESCERRFRITDFAEEGFRSPWLNAANTSQYIDCLYQLRTKLRPLGKRIFAGGIHYPTLVVANHLSPPVSTSASQWCWLDEVGANPNGLSKDVCCDTSRGPTGRTECWDGHFNFDLCCRGNVFPGELPHFFVAPAMDINVGSAVRQLGTFDLGQSYALQSLCNVGDVVVDVGANVGGFTVPLAERVGPSGEVHAFEPFRKIYQHLNANVALNGLTNVYTYNHALGVSTKVIEIHSPDLTNWNFPSAIRVKEQFGKDDALKHANLRYEQRKERVQVRHLDGLDFKRRINMIKIDVEFMELDVVLGAKATILRDQPIMWVENEPYFDDPPNTTFFDTMSSEFGYSCQAVARLELLCVPSGSGLPSRFQRVLRHLTGHTQDPALWQALSEADDSHSSNE